MLVFIFILMQCLHTVFMQGSEGFFNGTSYASISIMFNARSRTSLSFRTCSSGQLLYQEGHTGDFIALTLLPSGILEFKWQVNRQYSSVQLGSNLNNNHWHDVDIMHKLGSVTLSVSNHFVYIANSTSNDIFDINLNPINPQLIVGQGFTGCILQGAGVVLNDSNVQSFGVNWGKCPLPNKKNCDGYLVDNCFSQPCYKDSICVSLPNGYRCDCTVRYSGTNCEIDLGPLCSKAEYNQCMNGGVCQEDKFGNFTTCACPPKFTGTFCETMVDNTFCDHMPCRNGGTCNINKFQNGYVCTCPQGFAGIDCELNIDECQSSPCQNNGSCTDEINAYTCDCSGTGYRGPNCEENINECVESNPCYTGSRCFDRYGDYICECPHGFGGKNCDQEVNECDSNPCQNAGTCVDNLNGYLCHCVFGFAGINCEENIDDCSGEFCPANSHCVDGIDSYLCVCNPGYSGAVPHCKEIDECAAGPCLNGGTCQDHLNGFSCMCAEGFVGSHCEVNIDECESQPCQNGATCVDGAGTYSCECLTGYTGINCETDINDCDPDPCKNEAQCTDLVNDFLCECLPGWEGKTCVDNIDECQSQPCMHGQCIDSLNNFTCNCDPGFTGTLCDININECDSSPCFNGGTCTDLVNDYSCQCHVDFMGKNCEDLYNACFSSPCQNGGDCITSVPSHTYTCNCPSGYLGSQCEIDIDDCEGVTCPSGKVCVDLQNAYDCRCPIGFSGDNCSINIDECSSNPCVNGTCIDGVGAYACECPSGLTGKHCESDINECENSPCVHGICQNMFGSYLCYCKPGYTGTHCDIEFNECLSMPCKNNATCNDLVNNYSCSCLPGFAGRNCEVDINECASDPCMNGAACHDLINRYECLCIDGFSGRNCEINIDECASQPCLNKGICIDQINQFVCNCSDTGFTGMFCEININECSSNPCQHGAWCEDLIKDYACHCYDGYTGKNCETDIEECASSPCLNSALCLENSNQTLYEMNYLGFFPSFSYESASGYRCICSSGFTGENCETNIDDCEFNNCKNGICIDSINDYYCACHLGYDGQYCQREIDECQTFEPCENGATCVDLIADYKCECLPMFGGKNCQTRLIGCQNIICENGATCIPSLDDSGLHSYTCACMPGYHGKLCEIATTFSFNSTDSVSVIRYNDLLESFTLKLYFRTTLSNGLISSGYISDSLMYLLYLWNGMIKVDIFNETSRITELFSKNGQNDSFWKMIQLHFEPSKVSLNVSGWNIAKTINFSALNFSVKFGYQDQLPTYLMRDDINQIIGFIGCIQDISINGDVIIPNQNSVLQGAVEGCNRKEQCEGSPCHNGFCKDNWLSYECICSRPYFGSACEYSYEAATFGYRDEKSRAELLIPADKRSALSYETDISFFLRTRNNSGVVFYMGSSLNGSSDCNRQEQNVSFLLARLVMGKFQVILTVENGDIKELNHPKQLDNGENVFIKILKNSSFIGIKINDTSVTSHLTPSSSVCQEVLYIAGLPEITRQKRQIYSEPFSDKFDILLLEDVAFFKGIIHDFRINDKEVVFYDINAQGEGFPEIFGQAVLTDSVKQGVVSDDPCNTIQPCLHDSECRDLWNEYICICPDDFRGKNCQEKKPCAENSCPLDSECRNLDVGYECVASAAFNGKQSGLQYEVQDVNHNVTNITFSFRSKSSGTILWLESQQKSISNHFLHIEIVSGTLEVKWDLGPSYENLAPLHKTVSQKFKTENNGWHHVELWFDGNLVHLKVSGNPENLSEDNYAIGLSELLNEGANVYVGYKPEDSDSRFKGCLRDIRIGGLLLSFFNSTVFHDVNNPFSLVQQNMRIGCILCWDEDCVHGKCNNYTESYDCDCYDGYEGQTCDIDMCESQNPCLHGGSCYHSIEGISLMCSCPNEYTGPSCSEINYCSTMPCENGGICLPASGTYKCDCPDYYTGLNCEQLRVRDCNIVTCYHGSCLNVNASGIDKFKCICHDGYEGEYCNKTVDFCASNPCKNNGNCSIYEGPNFATYQCDCLDGFIGAHCELNVDECEENPCKHGRCIDGIGGFRCDCHPGYKGTLCDDKIQGCGDGKNICRNGTCEPTNDSYTCKCFSGYIGSHCSIFNECDDAKCSYQGECRPSYDEYELTFIHECKCKDGYSGTDCGTELKLSGNDDDTNIILMVLIPVLSLFLLCILIGSIIFLRVAKKKRATRGTYSPSRQEMFGSRVEMNHVMKPPPEERLI